MDMVNSRRMNIKLYSALLLVVLYSCNTKEVQSNDTDIEVKGRSSPTAVSVSLVQKKPFEQLVQVIGRVEAQSEVRIIARTSGIIKEVHVRNGDHVKAGQLILELDNEDQRLEMEKSVIMLEEKRISYEDQKMGFMSISDSGKRTEVLDNIKVTTGLALSEVNHQQAIRAFEKTKLRSPISGRISALKVKAFNPMQEGDLAAIIYDPHTLAVRCEVSELDALQLQRGDYAEINILGDPQGLRGRVLEVDARVDNVTRLVNVLVELEYDHRFIPGMSVHVTVKAPRNEALLIPKEAVVVKSGKSVAFTEEGGLAKWNYITLGRENGKEVEVLSGLTANKKVIITNNLHLVHDSPVQTVAN